MSNIRPFLRSGAQPLKRDVRGRITVAMGMYRSPNAKTIECLLATLDHANRVWQGQRAIIFQTITSTYIQSMRATAAEQAFSHDQCDALLFIDDDMYWPVGPQYGPELNGGLGFNPLTRLYELDKDVVGGLYFSRHMPLKPHMGWENAAGTSTHTPEEVRAACTSVEPFPCDFLGFGFIMIRRRAIEKILPLVGSNFGALFRFQSVWHRNPGSVKAAEVVFEKYANRGISTEEAISELDAIRHKAEDMGEDYSFCALARRAGCEVWCDPSWDLLHFGEYRYGRADWLAMNPPQPTEGSVHDDASAGGEPVRADG